MTKKEGKSTAQDKQNAKQELNLFTRAIEMSADGIVIGDLAGNITYVNGALLRMYGSEDKADLVGHNAIEFVAEKDRENARRDSCECMKNCQCFASELSA
jgi:PAS domain S-box-containing protein